MVGPLTSTPDVDPPDGDPLVVGVDDERADEVLSALTATTTRRVLAALHDEPSTPSALAKHLDTSLQNVNYHLTKLADAGLVEAADTMYSEKGREMTVYAPADRALVFVAGPESAGGAEEGLVATLKRLLGGVGVLGLASVAVERLLGPTARDAGDPDTGYTGNQSGTVATGTDESGAAETEAGGATGTEAVEATEKGQETATQPSSATEAMTETSQDAATTAAPQSTPSPEATQAATEFATTAADGGAVDALAASPGLLFFLGGLTALLLVTVLLWRR